MRVSFRPEATADLTEAYRWYERQRRGLGSEFEAVVEATLRLVQQAPEAFPVLHRGLRRVCWSGSPTPSTTTSRRTPSKSAAVFTLGGTPADGAAGRDA
jgi:plasmid stabilization system protein ParE